MPYTKDEIKLIERLGTLRQTEGLFVVIVPTFNRGYCLDRTLGSVLAQTDSHWICIVLDDGSTDNTVEIMRRWQDSDPRFFACHYQENRGGVAMNEIGMTLACEFGEFWTRLGSDDYFEPHKIALDRLAFDTGADAVYGPYRDLHETHLGEEVRNPPCDARGLLLSRGFAASWANIAVRVSALAAVRARHGNFVDSSIRNMEDWLLNTRLAYQFEFVWRGLRKRPGEAGQVVIGARDWAQVPGGPAEIVIDAVWRIGADGASQKPDICNLDARRTVDVLDDDAERFQPAPRAPVIAIGFQPWRGRDPGPSVALKPRLYPGGPPPTLPAPPEPEEAGFSLSTQGKTAPASAFSLATRRK